MNRKVYFSQGDRKIETTLDEIRAVQAAQEAAEAQRLARMDREGLKAAFWAVAGFAGCLALLVFL